MYRITIKNDWLATGFKNLDDAKKYAAKKYGNFTIIQESLSDDILLNFILTYYD